MKIKTQFAESFFSKIELEQSFEKAIEQLQNLKNKTGKGHDFLGWMNFPNEIKNSELNKIQNISKQLQQFETVVIIGIGGSYLGSKALIDLFNPYLKKQKTEILFAGQTLDSEYLKELLSYLKDKDFAIIAISKSGTTLEPALSFRLLLSEIIKQFGQKQIRNRVITITDKENGALKKLANKYKLESFVIPNTIGGRYSILTPVGLLPIAIAGINITELIEAAKDGILEYQKEAINNPAIIYASYRNLLHNKGFTNEIMVYSKPKWNSFSEWWKQLFGESEGKENKGIFPISMLITTDLHSLGQYVQEGKRNLFETFIRFKQNQKVLTISNSEHNLDQLNYLTGKSFHFVNSKAEEGTIEAHYKGGVPVIELEFDSLDVKTIGKLIYFYEISCAISAYMLEVNPFNQPGVEAYKQNMVKLLAT